MLSAKFVLQNSPQRVIANHVDNQLWTKDRHFKFNN